LQSFQFAHEVLTDVEHRQSLVENREDKALVQHYKMPLLCLPTSCNLQDIGCRDTTMEDRADMLREVELSVKDDIQVTKCVCVVAEGFLGLKTSMSRHSLDGVYSS